MPIDFPQHWQADIVLSDGRAAHLRPIRADDDVRLVDFYSRVSDRSKYYRFFAPYPTLSDTDVRRFTQVDYRRRVALVVLLGHKIIGVGRLDAIDARTAEVAFLIEDSHQGRGLGSVLLEHLAQIGRELGMEEFVADVLPSNAAMTRVFHDAGYRTTQILDDGLISVSISLAPTASSVAVSEGREHRAEARSIQAMLQPQSVAVIGASRSASKVGSSLLRHLIDGGFTGRVHPVNPELPPGTSVEGLVATPSVLDIEGGVDLALLAVPAEIVDSVAAECAAAGVAALVVVAVGFAETGEPLGLARQESLVRAAHAVGMRVLGPQSLGLINTALALNATLAPALPRRGNLGVFVQSGALGRGLLAQAAARDIGISTFVSAGNRADVSGNDLLQYWEEDPETSVIALYLESLGNPRKFRRIAARVSASKPIIAVATGRQLRRLPSGHGVVSDQLPDRAFTSVLRQSGVLQVASITELLDVATLLQRQPWPRGPRVRVVGNSDALGLVVADSAVSDELQIVGGTLDLGPSARPSEVAEAVCAAMHEPDCDSVVLVFVPTVDADDIDAVLDAVEVAVSAAVADGAEKPVVAMLPAYPLGLAQRRRIACYGEPHRAIGALGRAVSLNQWRGRDRTATPASPAVDVAALLKVADGADIAESTTLSYSRTQQVLALAGIDMLTTRVVETLDEAVSAGEQLGWNVVLKATAHAMRARLDLADVWRYIDGPDQMALAWSTLTSTLGSAAAAGFVVQPMAAPGVPVMVTSVEDPAFGPMISFGISGVSAAMLGDRSYRMAPLTDLDIEEMLSELGTAPLLEGRPGGVRPSRAVLVDLLRRVSTLADELPALERLALDPVLVRADGLSVLHARIVLASPQSRSDWFTRRIG